MPRLLPYLILVVAVLFFSTQSARAQAWVDPAGSLGVSLDYSYTPSDDVVQDPDLSFENYPIDAHGITLGAEYVPIENLAVSIALPLLMVKYKGDPADPEFPPHGEYDDGELHTTLTDLRANVRYNLLREPYVLVTPHLGVSIPVADYETVGFATAGRGLKQLHLGTSVARSLNPWVPELFFHLGFEFTLAERYDETEVTETFGQNRSDSSFLLGYLFLDGRLQVNLGGNLRLAHGNGVDFTDLPMLGAWPDTFLYHDALLREQFFLFGGGVGYAITNTLVVQAQARLFLWGYNTRDADLFGLGLTWSVL